MRITGPVAAVAVALAVAVLALAAALLDRGPESDYLDVEREVTGALVKVSADGDAIALDTEDGPFATGIVNGGAFALHPGDIVTGTVVKIPLVDGSGTREGLVVYEVTPGS